MRLDSFLTVNGLCASRTRAAKQIAAGGVTVNGVVVTKPATEIGETDAVELIGSVERFVSRGGEKLAAALKTFAIDVRGRSVLDVGASTGGFTDCLLQAGAARVIAVDSGKDQLVPVLRADERVTVMEGCNARYLTPDDLPHPCEMAVMDVSFISQTLLYPMLRAVLPAGGTFVSLIKPQFEAGRAALNKHGVVSDPKVRAAAVDAVCERAEAFGFRLCAKMQSPVVGGSGNIEYLAWFVLEDTP